MPVPSELLASMGGPLSKSRLMSLFLPVSSVGFRMVWILSQKAQNPLLKGCTFEVLNWGGGSVALCCFFDLVLNLFCWTSTLASMTIWISSWPATNILP